jgi:hypothetical protein
MNPIALARLALIAGALGAGTRASADYPALQSEFTTDLQSEWGVHAEDPRAERGETSLDLEAEIELALSPRVSIEGTVLGESVQDAAPGEDAWFEDQGAFVEELLLKYEHGPFEAVAGKFSPDYRNSREQERGIWTEDFSTEYEIVEKLGIGATYVLRTRSFGRHSVSVNAFANDTIVLAESIGNERDERCRGDRDLSSSAFLFDGQRGFGSLTPYYQLGYRHIDGCEVDDTDEAGWLARLGGRLEFAPRGRVSSDLVAELGFVEDFEGSDADRWYWSLSSANRIGEHWTVYVGGTLRQIARPGRSDALDHLFQLSAAWRPRRGIRIEAGWLNLEEAGLENNVLGVLLRYRLRF